MAPTNPTTQALENLLETASVSEILDALQEICAKRSIHHRANQDWQANSLWDWQAGFCEAASNGIKEIEAKGGIVSVRKHRL